MGKDAKAMEILRKNGLSAKDYVVGVRALRMAFIAPTSGSKMDAVDGIGRRTTPSQV